MLIWHFSMNPDIYIDVGKLPNLHFNEWLFSNPGEKILILIEILCSQDLTVELILWQSFPLQDTSWYAHNTVFCLKTLLDNAQNQTHLKIFQGSVSSCLFWEPGNVLIQTKNSSNFAFLVTLLCFFKMAFACSALSLNLAIESFASSV